MTWQPGDALPEGELWSLAMVAQFCKRSPRTVQRLGIPNVPGLKGVYEPSVVRAFFSREFQGVGVGRRIQGHTNRVSPIGT